MTILPACVFTGSEQTAHLPAQLTPFFYHPNNDDSSTEDVAADDSTEEEEGGGAVADVQLEEDDGAPGSPVQAVGGPEAALSLEGSGQELLLPPSQMVARVEDPVATNLKETRPAWDQEEFPQVSHVSISVDGGDLDTTFQHIQKYIFYIFKNSGPSQVEGE